MKKENIIIGFLVVSIAICILLIFSMKNNKSENIQEIVVDNKIKVIFKEKRNNIYNIQKLSENNPDNQITFSLKNLTKNILKYEIILNYANDVQDKVRYNDEYLRFSLEEIDGSKTKSIIQNAYFESIKNYVLYTDSLGNVDKTYRLKVWLSSDALIKENFYANIRLTFQVLDEENEEQNISSVPEKASTKVLNRIKADSNNDNLYEDNGVKYFSGKSNNVYYNYVWYSGKLWRIVAIYPDGSMKLITDQIMTHFEREIEYYNENIMETQLYTWLNEDFLDSLYNYENIIDKNKKWDVTPIEEDLWGDMMYDRLPDKPSSLRGGLGQYYNGNKQEISANVGLLTVYEYIYSYAKIWEHADNNYHFLDSNYLGKTVGDTSWLFFGTDVASLGWFLNPIHRKYDEPINGKLEVTDFGKVSDLNGIDAQCTSLGIRPAIYIKSDLEFVGNGTVKDPYRIVTDKAYGNAGELVNTRISGEYIKFKNDQEIYRILQKDNGLTKIISASSIEVDNKLAFAFDKYFVSENGHWIVQNNPNAKFNIYGEDKAQGEGTYYHYLNNEWYQYLVNKNGDILTSGIYYYGYVNESNGTNYCYKTSICHNNKDNLKKKTSDCLKTDKSKTLLVGLPRYGELYYAADRFFEDMSLQSFFTVPVYWPSITRQDSSQIFILSSSGGFFYLGYGIPTLSTDYNKNNSLFKSIRLKVTLYLKDNVKIISGNGTYNNPYIVGI